MSKAKSPKNGLSLLNSLQICRPKNPSSMIKSPLPAVTYMYSPINSKTFDISFPSFPDPPPSTPSKIIPLENECTSHAHSKPRNDADETYWQIAPSKTEEKKHKNMRKKSISPGDHVSNHPHKTAYDKENRKKELEQRSGKARRFKRYGSKEWKEEGEYHEKQQISRRVGGPCMMDRGIVNESFVVVKRSADPYEDFKKSMSEMIVEKQIFEAKVLEELLMSYLSLNSRLHHKVIIEAFTQVLEEVFCG